MTQKTYTRFETLEIDEDGDNRLEATIHEDCSVYVVIENDWAGDTESGFGQSCCITLKPEGVANLRDFLNKAKGVS